MSSSTPSSDPHPPFPSLAQTLPPEVLDQILSIHFSKKHQGADKIGKGLSLICRNWSGPVQRLLFQSVTVRSVVKLHELGRVKTSLGEVVRSLNVEVVDKGSKWKIRELNDVLETLPRLKSLSLYLNASSPGHAGSYAAIKQLPNLEELSLRSSEYDSNMVSYRQILAATPKITSLRLDTDHTRSCKPPNKKRPAVVLPSLVKLSLNGAQLCRTFEGTNLLSESTLKQINYLELSEDYTAWIRKLENYSPALLMKIIGESVKTLRFGDYIDTMSDEALVSSCPNLKTLISPRSVYFLAVPASLSKIIYEAKYKDDCNWILQSYSYSISAWTNIKKVHINNAAVAQEVKDEIVAKGIELVVDGVVYYPGAPASA